MTPFTCFYVALAFMPGNIVSTHIESFVKDYANKDVAYAQCVEFRDAKYKALVVSGDAEVRHISISKSGIWDQRTLAGEFGRD